MTTMPLFHKMEMIVAVFHKGNLCYVFIIIHSIIISIVLVEIIILSLL